MFGVFVYLKMSLFIPKLQCDTVARYRITDLKNFLRTLKVLLLSGEALKMCTDYILV